MNDENITAALKHAYDRGYDAGYKAGEEDCATALSSNATVPSNSEKLLASIRQHLIDKKQ